MTAKVTYIIRPQALSHRITTLGKQEKIKGDRVTPSLTLILWSWLISTPFASPFQAGRNPTILFVIENDIFNVKIAKFIVEMDSGSSMTP